MQRLTQRPFLAYPAFPRRNLYRSRARIRIPAARRLDVRVRSSNESFLHFFLIFESLLNLSKYPLDILSRIHQPFYINSRQG